MKNLDYKLIRAKRKTVSLTVKSDGSLIVHAPLICPRYEIDKFVESKRDWIEKKQAKITNFENNHPKGTIPYLGKNYNIITGANEFKIEGENIFVHDEKELINWLCHEAAQILEKRVKKYIDIMKVTPRKIKLSNAKTHWGMCSGKKSITLSWRLIFCPLSVIDYVIVHEFSHLTYMNHSKEFWARVEEILPNFKEDREWLKANNKLMELYKI